MFDVDLPSKKCLYQIQAERIRKLEQLANEQFHTETGTISWLVCIDEIHKCICEHHLGLS
jgi:UDP-N-acetylglucosamine/UDP-N-acetylgalactosamine diphosphorylase